MKVSVIVCCFNHGKYLSKCLNSILNQDYEDKEVIVVNDGSTDNTQEVMDYYGDKIIQIVNKKNINLMASRKKAFDISTGSNILFIDADDFYLKNNVISSYMKFSNFDIVQSLVQTSDPYAGQVSNNAVSKLDSYIPSIIRKIAGKNSFIWNKMFSREIVEKAYSQLEITDSFMNEDTVLVRTIINNAKTYKYLPMVTYYYNLNTGYSNNIKLLEEYGGRVGNLKLNTVTINA